jgi:hypothetical protein
MIDGRAVLERTVRLPGCSPECASVNSYRDMLMDGHDVPSLEGNVGYRWRAQSHFVVLKPRIPVESRHTGVNPD